jgi:hypothetical protein
MIIHEDKFDKFQENCPLLFVDEFGDMRCKANPQRKHNKVYNKIYNYNYCCYENCPMVFWINAITE